MPFVIQAWRSAFSKWFTAPSTKRGDSLISWKREKNDSGIQDVTCLPTHRHLPVHQPKEKQLPTDKQSTLFDRHQGWFIRGLKQTNIFPMAAEEASSYHSLGLCSCSCTAAWCSCSSTANASSSHLHARPCCPSCCGRTILNNYHPQRWFPWVFHG